MRSLIALIFLLAVICFAHGKQSRRPVTIFDAGKTIGQPWPKPQSIQPTPQQLAIHPDAFHFLVNSTSQTCDILTNALDRYFRLIFFPQSYMNYILNPKSAHSHSKEKPKKTLADLRDTPSLKRLNVYVQQPCDQYPSLESNESCKKKLPLSFSNDSDFLFQIP